MCGCFGVWIEDNAGDCFGLIFSGDADSEFGVIVDNSIDADEDGIGLGSDFLDDLAGGRV